MPTRAGRTLGLGLSLIAEALLSLAPMAVRACEHSAADPTARAQAKLLFTAPPPKAAASARCWA